MFYEPSSWVALIYMILHGIVCHTFRGVEGMARDVGRPRHKLQDFPKLEKAGDVLQHIRTLQGCNILALNNVARIKTLLQLSNGRYQPMLMRNIFSFLMNAGILALQRPIVR
mmetsp:Transcript_10417/g.63638  ORF Transcript_10417/g.63638 Transcript_10417/m.63638 type:complete len:112 (-) Transcript_10417:595-930(-)